MTSTMQRLASRRFDVLLTLAGILGIVLFLALYNEAFPDAAIDLTLSRDQIAQQANNYLKSQGYDVAAYESVVDFNQNWWSSVYLQRTLGVAETNRLVKAERLPIWTWKARWFKPQQQEEFSLELMPDGEVIGFSHTISETAPGAALEQNAARAIAEKYLTADRQLNLNDLELTSASSQEQPGGRIDHRFEWKRRDFALGDGDLRRAISVQGDRVGNYTTWLRVPEAFERDFSAQRNVAGYINNTAFFTGFTLFGAIGLAALGLGALRGVIEWRTALIPALLVGGISLLSGLNTLPLYKTGYSTTNNYVLFWLGNIVGILFNALYNFVFVAILWLGGTALAKQRWPRQDKILPRGDRWLSLYGWRGLMLGGVGFGYVTLFYLIAVKFFNGWTPLDAPGGYAVATPFPFLGPLASGIIPATTEELLFRLIGITAVLLAFKKRWLALLIPGMLWAFAHTGYVTEPIILRGIELTIEAVLISGLFFLRFGLFTTIMAHFAYNAGLGALPLLRSSDPYFVLSGLIVIAAMLLPIIPGAIKWLRLRGRPIIPVAAPQIDLATLDDVDRLTALAIKDTAWATWLNDPSVVVVCARSTPAIVGATAARIAADGVTEILTTYVDPQWRRRYLGSELIDHLTNILRERGAKFVEITVAWHDERGTGFFASQDWKQRVRVYSRSLLPPEARPTGRRARIRAWFKRLQNGPIN